MITVRDGFSARWRGREYDVSPDGAELRLYAGERRGGLLAGPTGPLRPCRARQRGRRFLLRPHDLHLAG